MINHSVYSLRRLSLTVAFCPIRKLYWFLLLEFLETDPLISTFQDRLTQWAGPKVVIELSDRPQ